jgi:hypothetical protein
MMSLETLTTNRMMGWPLFPVSHKNKKPFAGSGGFKDATTDAAHAAWHAQYPGCAWGVATSAERGVIDIDPRAEGRTVLAVQNSLLIVLGTHGAAWATEFENSSSSGVLAR